MSITIQEVKKIASLARIKLSAEEEKRHADTISAVLDYMKILNEVDTNGVEPTYQVTGLSDKTREDIVKKSGREKELVAQLPETAMGELVVPGVFE